MLLYDDHRDVIYSLAFSADGSFLASASRDGTVLLRGVDGSLEPLATFGGAIYTLAFHPELPILAIGGERGWSAFRQNDDGTWGPFGPAMNTPTTDLAFLDRQTLVVGLGDRLHATAGRFELWNFTAGRKIDPSFPELNGVRAVAVCPRKQIVAWASNRRAASVWDIRKQDPLKFTQKSNCLAIAIDRDATTLALAGDYVVRLFDIERKREKALLNVHKGQVHALAFSPDGKTLATGSWDQTVRLWDAATGQERETLRWPIGGVMKLAFAPDGLRLAAAGDSGAVVVWDVE